jgi:hypothetical protein
LFRFYFYRYNSVGHYIFHDSSVISGGDLVREQNYRIRAFTSDRRGGDPGEVASFVCVPAKKQTSLVVRLLLGMRPHPDRNRRWSSVG